jgi:hypothetical protein
MAFGVAKSRAVMKLLDVGAVLDLAKVRAFSGVAESMTMMKLHDVGAVLDLANVRAHCVAERSLGVAKDWASAFGLKKI